jgi:intraflagellar transport protein 81
VLKGEDFKQYVNLLREKSLNYKQKRADLSDLKAEYGVLERTLEVLKYVEGFSFKLKRQSREN